MRSQLSFTKSRGIFLWEWYLFLVLKYIHLLEQLLRTLSSSMHLRPNTINLADIPFTNLQHTIPELPNPTGRSQAPLSSFLQFRFLFDRHQNSRFL